ncbi:hypothetical protein B0T20DRAFT_347220, partial [Sordaria brevicollis]
IYIDNIIIFFNILKDYLQYFDKIFGLFAFYNLTLLLKKNYIIYLNVKLLGFYVNILKLFIIEEKLEAFWNLIFPKTLKSLEIYIGGFKFIYYLILYYGKISELL